MIRLALAVLALALFASVAHAEPCPPAATVDGDATLVAAVSEALAAHGIGAGEASCPGVRAHVVARGDQIAVQVDADGSTIERVVTSSEVAATVIESWARTDVAAPLLAARPAPVRVARALPPDPPAPIVVTRFVPSSRGIAVFASGQTSLGNDLTTWAGAEVGACVGLGPVCAAVRLRLSQVVGGGDIWNTVLDRRGAEVLLGGDVPFVRGPLTLIGGIAAGLGSIKTHVEDAGRHIGSETGGLRGDLHVALDYRLVRHLDAEISLAADVTQATHVESNTTMPIPDEPWLLMRLGAGLRVEGL